MGLVAELAFVGLGNEAMHALDGGGGQRAEEDADDYDDDGGDGAGQHRRSLTLGRRDDERLGLG